MNVIEPIEKSNLVRVDSIKEGNGFVDFEGYYYLVLDMLSYYFDCSVKSNVTTIDPIWVFNVNSGCLAIYKSDAMVEPVELEVHVKEKT